MAVTPREVPSGATIVVSGVNPVISRHANIQAGDVLVFVSMFRANGAVTWTVPAGFTQRFFQNVGASGSGIAVFVGVAGSSETSYAFTPSVNSSLYRTYLVGAYVGAKTPDAANSVANGSGTASTSHVSPSIVPYNGGAIAIAWGTSVTTTYTGPPSPFQTVSTGTQGSNNSAMTMLVGHEFTSSTVSVTRTATAAASSVFLSAAIALEPAPVTGAATLTAAGVPNANSLSWTTVPAATGYYVYRDGTQIASVTTKSYSDMGATVGQQHSYYVVGFNELGSGPASNTATSTALRGKKAYWRRWNYGTNWAVTPTGADVDSVIQDNNLDTYVRINGTATSSARAEIEPASIPTDIDYTKDMSITMVFSASGNNGVTEISLWHSGIGTYYDGPYSQSSPSSRVTHTFTLNAGSVSASDLADFTIILVQNGGDFVPFVDIHEAYTTYASTLPDEPVATTFQMVGVPI